MWHINTFLNESWTISAPICLNRFTPFPSLALWPSRPPAIETPPRSVPAGPLISWPRNASCSRIPHRASRASLPPRRWAIPRHRLSLRPHFRQGSSFLPGLMMMMIAFITIKSSLVPLIEGLCALTDTFIAGDTIKSRADWMISQEIYAHRYTHTEGDKGRQILWLLKRFYSFWRDFILICY